jgi:hypothetical protein
LALVAEIIKQNVPRGWPITSNYRQFCWEQGMSSVQKLSSVEKIKVITIWLRSKSVTLQQVVQCDEALAAKNILMDEDSNEQSFEAASNLFKGIVEAISFTDQQLEVKIFEEIISFETALLIFIEKKLSTKVKFLCQLFATLAEKFMPKLVIEGHYSRKIIPYIMDITKIPEVSSFTLKFWRLLPNHLKSSKQKEEFAKTFEVLMLSFVQCMQKSKITSPNGNAQQKVGKFSKILIKKLELTELDLKNFLKLNLSCSITCI